MKVYLIGAGPGDAGLLTLKGRDALAGADVVVYDALANEALLDHVRPDAEKIYVGKVAGNHALPQDQINALLVAIARSKSDVVDHFERLEHIWQEYGVFVSMEEENQ